MVFFLNLIPVRLLFSMFWKTAENPRNDWGAGEVQKGSTCQPSVAYGEGPYKLQTTAPMGG